MYQKYLKSFRILILRAQIVLSRQPLVTLRTKSTEDSMYPKIKSMTTHFISIIANHVNLASTKLNE